MAEEVILLTIESVLKTKDIQKNPIHIELKIETEKHVPKF